MYRWFIGIASVVLAPVVVPLAGLITLEANISLLTHPIGWVCDNGSCSHSMFDWVELVLIVAFADVMILVCPILLILAAWCHCFRPRQFVSS